jgi:hypothetical protein
MCCLSGLVSLTGECLWLHRKTWQYRRQQAVRRPFEWRWSCNTWSLFIFWWCLPRSTGTHYFFNTLLTCLFTWSAFFVCVPHKTVEQINITLCFCKGINQTRWVVKKQQTVCLLLLRNGSLAGRILLLVIINLSESPQDKLSFCIFPTSMQLHNSHVAWSQKLRGKRISIFYNSWLYSALMHCWYFFFLLSLVVFERWAFYTP